MAASLVRWMNNQANGDIEGTFAYRMREKRNRLFKSLVHTFTPPIRILDIGGTDAFWETMGWAGDSNYRITLVNLFPIPKKYDNVEPTVGDATDLKGVDADSYDIAFSNSVIEHLFNYENQVKMADEMRRIGKAYWVQTPNFWFPIEPHFLFPFWHWMPRGMRIAMLRRMRCGRCPKKPDYEEAAKIVDEPKLLKKGQMRRLFPEANIVGERYFGLTKSWVAYNGFDQSNGAGGGA